MKNEQEKSDPSVVAKRPANKPEIAEVDLWGSGAESAERREGTEANTGEQRTCRTPSRGSVSPGARTCTRSSKAKKEGTVHRFVAPCNDRSIKGCIFLAQAGSGTRGRWSNMAKLQAEPGSQPTRIAFAHTSGHLPSAPFKTAVHPKTGWAATPAGDRRA